MTLLADKHIVQIASLNLTYMQLLYLTEAQRTILGNESVTNCIRC